VSRVRLLRLQSDYEAVRRLVRQHPKVTVEGVSGTPPDRYRLVLHVRSLREQGERIVVADQHRLEIVLPQGYPRDPPLCRLLTPVFHPNIAPHAVCIGDHWTAGESLDVMIQRVGEMLAFQSYNVKSPLNGRAAQWVEEHRDQLPVDRAEFFVDLSAAPPADEPPLGRCANCGASATSLAPCAAGHALCADCTARCPRCGANLCVLCGVSVCTACDRKACTNCGARPATARACAAGHSICPDCDTACPTCGRALCVACGEYPCSTCAPARAARRGP
jgi:ubiquitin-protein ligase